MGFCCWCYLEIGADRAKMRHTLTHNQEANGKKPSTGLLNYYYRYIQYYSIYVSSFGRLRLIPVAFSSVAVHTVKASVCWEYSNISSSPLTCPMPALYVGPPSGRRQPPTAHSGVFHRAVARHMRQCHMPTCCIEDTIILSWQSRARGTWGPSPRTE